jgi:3-carboxy-cis,cis-muconate cycloisomerase
MAMAASTGRLEAHHIVEAASRRAVESGGTLREELVEDAEVLAVLSQDEVEAALDPERYLGSAEAFVDRALKRYRGERS